ncbi:terpenoid cyclases/Protein prenyltransferase [Rhizodiscina lignyota]|uniref:Protein farnesyltransferase subunit beta n=1 Tax=Rhizodiscina lignyota TaxID=1504668 RepID=A0A9P4IMI5_9PEZI|nr:terpenoid cyclases/Protein prenyltransferase [Rhizodiscina lignyota]
MVDRFWVRQESLSAPFTLPALYTSLPPLRDSLVTESSRLLDQTAAECMPYLTLTKFKTRDLNSHGLQKLRRARHIEFANDSLEELPGYMVVLDASRPWMGYWGIAALSMLRVDLVEEGYRERTVDTFRACQNESGGFGGGHGQYSHLACSYAAVLSLVAVGGEAAYETIDRRAMWRWLGRMKQPDGGFTVCEGAEEDVRGAFCAMVLCSLLNLPLELPPEEMDRVGGDGTLLSGLGEWISRCQTFEGGLSDAPNHEAHGAYAFCALGCLCILGPPHETIPRYLNVDNLLSWLSHRQAVPEGGFAGRTNKLVDGCYSHWDGGCWALVEAALASRGFGGSSSLDSLWDREGLLRYILCCAQNEWGGLRDKPSKNPDGYHTCYNLAGLSWAQNYHVWNAEKEDIDMTAPLSAPFSWSTTEKPDLPCDEEDRVAPMHPIYVIPHEKATEARNYFLNRVGF